MRRRGCEERERFEERGGFESQACMQMAGKEYGVGWRWECAWGAVGTLNVSKSPSCRLCYSAKGAAAAAADAPRAQGRTCSDTLHKQSHAYTNRQLLWERCEDKGETGT